MSLLELQGLEAHDAARRGGGRNPQDSNISLLICDGNTSQLSVALCD